MERAFNFSAGPAVLPEPALTELQNNLFSFAGTGIGVLELSHRSKEFEGIIAETEAAFRRLLQIGDDYHVLFTTGGATAQFAMVPLNLVPQGTQANYLVGGIWAEAAYEEAKRLTNAHIAGSSKEAGFRTLPTLESLSEKPAYLHFTSNNTVIGSQYATEPAEPGVVLVCDASSDLLHKKIDVSKYGLIYAGAQKNLGTAGVTVVIVKKDLLAQAAPQLPLTLDYQTYAKNRSLYNTPPTGPIYIVGLVLKWIESLGGLQEMERMNREKAAVLYQELDRNPFFTPYVDVGCRSLMNVTFRLPTPELEDAFVKEAAKHRLLGLKGHRLVGGIRASIYNAFPKAGVEALVSFMSEFARRNG
ncbi:MAG: 3-phosphoserine/phosphohydroxythreonine transaminase [Bdellovibrionota bacterium]